jgi:hypothetical protein
MSSSNYGFASTVRNSCLEFFQKEDIQHYVKEIMRPIVHIIYNEIYPYIWFICIYNVFLIFLTLANLVILLWLRTTIYSIQRNLHMSSSSSSYPSCSV